MFKILNDKNLPAPMVPIELLSPHRVVKALIDTGASISVVTADFIRSLGLTDKILQLPEKHHIQVADGQKVKVVGQIEKQVEVIKAFYHT